AASPSVAPIRRLPTSTSRSRSCGTTASASSLRRPTIQPEALVDPVAALAHPDEFRPFHGSRRGEGDRAVVLDQQPLAFLARRIEARLGEVVDAGTLRAAEAARLDAGHRAGDVLAHGQADVAIGVAGVERRQP